MEIDDKEFKDLKSKVQEMYDTVNKMYCWVTGDEFQNGAIRRIKKLEEKEKKRDRRWWMTLGGFTVLIFILKWGDEIINLL